MAAPSYPKPVIRERARFTEEDRARIRRCRRAHNRLGFAYQLAFLRLTGRLPSQQPLEILPDLLEYVAAQLGTGWEAIRDYAERQPTVSRHADQVAEHLGYRALTGEERTRLGAFLESEAQHLEQTSALIGRAEEHLRRRRVLLPARSALRRIAQAARAAYRERLMGRVMNELPGEMQSALDALLEVEQSETVSPLQALKEPPGMASPRAFKAEARKLRQVEATGILGVDLSWIRGSLRKALARRARRSDVHRLRRLTPPHRYAALACFLTELHADTIDTLVEMHAKIMTGTYRRAKNQLEGQLQTHRREVLGALRSFRSIARLVLDMGVADEDLRAAILEEAPAGRLEAELARAEEHLSGPKSDVFPFVKDRFGYLRQFAPTLLEALSLETGPAGNEDLAEAARILHRMNEEGRRKVPPDAPTSFLKDKNRRFVEREGDGGENDRSNGSLELDRAGYECAVLTALRDEIRRGNLYVAGSRRFRPTEEFLMPENEWAAAKAEFFARSGLPASPGEAAAHLRARLGQAYDRFLTGLPKNAYVRVGDGGQWQFGSDPAEKLSAEDEEHLDRLTGWLKKKVRRIKLPDLLIEVDNDLRFTRHVLARGTLAKGLSRKTARAKETARAKGAPEQLPEGRPGRTPEAVCEAVAAVMAYGCNLGPVAMARLTRGVSYRQIKRVADWHLHDDALRAALADVADGIAGLDTATVWGEGKASSSDGQRFIFPRKTVKRTYSHRLSDYALEFYSFVADNYAPFYSVPIECDERDAAYVLDGLLYHEADLDPEEHYTDTHGYTECNFAAFAMLGKRFCPRIRGLKKQRIYHADSERNYGPLTAMLAPGSRRVRLGWIEGHWDLANRLVASFAHGHATASVVMKRLVGFGAKNRLYRAMRELGRVFKTEFVLDYLARPDLRRRVRRGLLKSEELNAMARSVFYGKLGRADWRDFRRQMSSASCLTLILASIIYWQIREIERAIAEADEHELARLRLDLLSHVSPIGWENVTLYGEYVLRPGLVRA